MVAWLLIFASEYTLRETPYLRARPAGPAGWKGFDGLRDWPIVHRALGLSAACGLFSEFLVEVTPFSGPSRSLFRFESVTGSTLSSFPGRSQVAWAATELNLR
jgi:hypothetical protein